MGVKQKSQASAAFLGVLIVSENVVCGCCIPTTTFDGPRVWKATSGTLRTEGQTSSLREAPANQASPAKCGFSHLRGAATKKAAALDAAAFRNIFLDRRRAS
jgi:hypothetical protein